MFAWNHPRVLVDTDHVEENRHQTVQIVELHHMAMPGQSGRDPKTGLTAEGVEAQTEQTLRNIETILKAAGTDLQHVLRCGVFLMDMAEFPKMNAVYERMFAGHKPARTTVQVSGLPGENLRVEIDCIAVLPID